jgi:hypothetical protein
MPQIPSDPELKAIESALGELIPRSSRLDRDKLMFQAGAMSKRASARRWAWPAITAALSVALAGESLFLGARPAPRVVERIVFLPAKADAAADASRPGPRPPEIAVADASRPEPFPPGIANGHLVRPGPFSSGSSGGASDYQRFQNLVILFGLDALPERAVVVAREDDRGIEPRSGLKPAGALRSLELEKILKPGGPS